MIAAAYFTQYPLSPAILGNLCVSFMLSLDLEHSCVVLPTPSVHVLVKDYNKSKFVYKYVPPQDSVGSKAVYNICSFPCCCHISFSVPLTHSGGFIFLPDISVLLYLYATFQALSS